MRVVIKGREYEYLSDYPAGWEGETYKNGVRIGRFDCFVKRLENKQPADIAGWQLLEELKGKLRPNLLRLYDIVSTTEKQQPVQYLFYEHITGETLQAQSLKQEPVNLLRLTADLFQGLEALHRLQHWYAELTEKDILYDSSGQRYLLVNLDSTRPISARPDPELIEEKTDWALVLQFYREEADLPILQINELPGPVLNYLQVIFLILRLKFHQTFPEQPVAQAANKSEHLVGYLAAANGNFRQVFKRAYQASRESDFLSWSSELQAIIEQQLIGGALKPPAITPKTEVAYPQIIYFSGSAVEVEVEQPFNLSWQVEQATQLVILRNGSIYENVATGQNQLIVQEEVAGEVQYVLQATNQAYQIESHPVMVQVKNKPVTPPVPLVSVTPPTESEPPPLITITASEPPVSNNSTVKFNWIIPVTILVSLIAIILILFFNPFTRKPEIYSIQSYLPERRLLKIVGNNFSAKNNPAQVYLGGIKGKVIKSGTDTLQVQIPETGAFTQKDSVRVMVVINKDTAYAPKYLRLVNTYADADAGVKTEDHDPIDLPDTNSAENLTPPVITLMPDQNEDEDQQIHTPDKITPSKTKSQTKPRSVKNKNNKSEKPLTPVAKPKFVLDTFLQQYIVIKSNVTEKKLLGGIHNLRVTVVNRSKYNLDAVYLRIIYFNKKKEVGQNELTLRDVKAFSSSTANVPDFDRGNNVSFYVKVISSSQLAQDFQIE